MKDSNLLLLQAAHFAAQKHKGQKRKGAAEIPYINHPIKVARYLCEIGGVNDPEVLAAALLHDTIEDTDATEAKLGSLFGSRVAAIVMEVSDDKELSKAERKQNQIEHAPHLSEEAKALKLADKIANVEDMIVNPPADWSKERRCEYVQWGKDVVAGLTGVNKALEDRFAEVAAKAMCELENT